MCYFAAVQHRLGASRLLPRHLEGHGKLYVAHRGAMEDTPTPARPSGRLQRHGIHPSWGCSATDPCCACAAPCAHSRVCGWRGEGWVVTRCRARPRGARASWACGEPEHLGGALRLVQRPRHPQSPTRPPLAHSSPDPIVVRVPVLEIIGDRVGQSWGLEGCAWT